MAWFSPIKGAYPGLVQIDKTLPAASDAEGIVRGSVVYVTSDNTFAPCTDAQATDPEAYPFFVLVGQDDFQAGMAGTVGYGDGDKLRRNQPACYASRRWNRQGHGSRRRHAHGIPDRPVRGYSRVRGWRLSYCRHIDRRNRHKRTSSSARTRCKRRRSGHSRTYGSLGK